MKNAPETARGENRLNRRSSTISRASLGRCPWDVAARQSLPRQSPMSAVEVPRIERPRRQPRFRSADMTADRSGGTSTGSLYTGRLSTVRQCYTAVDVPSGCVCAGIRTTVERTGVRWASCRPSMRVCPDIPASNPRKTVPHLRGKHRRRPEHKPDITTRLRPHCNSPQPQHGPDGIACTTR